MAFNNFKNILGRGIILAIPLGVIIYVFIRLIGMLATFIQPLAMKLGIQRILGEFTLIIFAVLLIIIFMYILGLLMGLSFIASLSKKMENLVYRLVPSLNQIKLLATEKLDFNTQLDSWKPVILYYEEKYSPAYVVEEDDQMITLFVIKGTTLSDGEILITKRDDVSLQEITTAQLHQFSRQYGKGFLSVVNKNPAKS
ncbi:hypothetical protein COR50_20080 [Chitinophaga caeni]|uniref:DUF502 domain-containing protein n=1 Tax=Chitinophaga caeni TaxID=2029983 RepID=A0A291QZ72_9BACT|nr:hypothetical protein [Chitinophaga caeni]ATL49286.1 hypothetical protein COR50_20080 [Chitinophaga caeni]